MVPAIAVLGRPSTARPAVSAADPDAPSVTATFARKPICPSTITVRRVGSTAATAARISSKVKGMREGLTKETTATGAVKVSVLPWRSIPLWSKAPPRMPPAQRCRS